MKNFVQGIVFVAAMLMCGVSFAGIDKDDLTDFNNLSDSQKAAIVQQMATFKEQNGGNIPTTPEKLREWAEVGSAIGKGLVATARELGTEVNEFAKTDVGKLAIVLLVWKVMGGDLLHVVGGIMWFVVALPMWMYYFRKLCIVKEIKYNADGKKAGIVHFERNEVEEARVTMTIALIVVIAIGLFTTFSY